jgi:chemotaxis protein MotB
MGKKKQEEQPAGSPAWMTTFSDLNSLLLTMFIALFSMATISPGKFQQAVMSFRDPFDGQPLGLLVGGKSLSEDPLITSQPGIQQELLKIIQDEKYKGKITIEETERGTIISLSDMSFFESGSARLTASTKDLLYRIGIIILEYTRNEIEIYGYTDDTQTTTSNLYPTNWHLGAARSASVASFFTGELRDRRKIERAAEIRAGQFDIDYFYTMERFFPIAVGERDIMKEIELLNYEFDSRVSQASRNFQEGRISAFELTQIQTNLENQLENQLNDLRNKFRRIDILILRQRIR